MKDNKPILYTREIVAEIFDISLPTLDRMIKSGKLEAVRIGRSVRIPKTEVERVIREGIGIDESW